MRSQNARVQAMLAASSAGAVQIESIETMYGMDRSPKAVSRRGDAAVAPPKVQIDDSVFGDGGAALPSRIDVDRVVGQAAHVVALPVRPVLAERDDGVEQLLDLAVVHLPGEVGRPARPARAAAAAAPRPRRRRRRRPRRSCRPAGPRPLGIVRIVPGSSRTRRASRRRRCLSARKSRQKRIGPLPALERVERRAEHQRRARPGAGRTRTR